MLGRLRRGPLDLGRGGQQVAERAGLGRQTGSWPALDDPALIEHGDLLGALGGREPVRHEQAGAAREQPVGRPDDVTLGHRVHPRGRLVEHDDAHVAHQEPREGDQLLLPRGQRGAAGTEQGVEPVGEAGHPVGQAELRHRGLDVRTRDVPEERDVLREGAGEDLGALGDDPDRGAQLLHVEVEHVDPAEQDRVALGLDRAGEQGGQGGLAGPGAPHQRAGGAGRHVQVDVLQGEPALGVREVQVAEREVEPSRGQPIAAGGLAHRAEESAQAQHRPEAGLQIGQVAGQHVDVADEHGRHQEQRHQLGGREAVVDDERDPDQRGGREGTVQDACRYDG